MPERPIHCGQPALWDYDEDEGRSYLVCTVCHRTLSAETEAARQAVAWEGTPRGDD